MDRGLFLLLFLLFIIVVVAVGVIEVRDNFCNWLQRREIFVDRGFYSHRKSRRMGERDSEKTKHAHNGSVIYTSLLNICINYIQNYNLMPQALGAVNETQNMHIFSNVSIQQLKETKKRKNIFITDIITHRCCLQN